MVTAAAFQHSLTEALFPQNRLAGAVCDQRAEPLQDRSIFFLVVIIALKIRMQRIVGAEEQVAEPKRGVLAAHCAPLAAGEILEVGGILAQHAEQGFAPCGIAAYWMRGVLSHPLD